MPPSRRLTWQFAAVATLMILSPATCRAQALDGSTPFARLEAGALNRDEPLSATPAYGASIGVQRGRRALGLRVIVQGDDSNGGRDLTRKQRTFVLATGEVQGTPGAGMERQVFLRLGAGALLRGPWRAAPAGSVELGWRYRLRHHLLVVGALGDAVAWIPEQTVPCLKYGLPNVCSATAGPQSNFTMTAALELHP